MVNHARSHLLAALAVVATSLAVLAQPVKPKFEVASVRPYTANLTFSDIQASSQWVRPGGAFSVTRITVATLMSYAYGLKAYQIVGGPDWIRRDTFAINARAGRDITDDEAKAMVQSMFEERFKLVVHTEQHEMRFRALVLANADGKLGPYMKRMASCTPEAQAEARKQFPPRTVDPNARGGWMTGSCTDLTVMELFLTQVSDVPVLDRTGSRDKFTYDLRYVSDGGSDGVRTIPTELMDAMEEQLGLTLRPHQEKTTVMVIDAIERPSEN